MSHTGDKVAEFLRNAATKIEELQVQASLGKAEFSDNWENIKTEARKEYNKAKAEINSVYEANKDKIDVLKSKLEHLEVQFALGKAETKELLEEQRRKIRDAIHDLKQWIDKA